MIKLISVILAINMFGADFKNTNILNIEKSIVYNEYSKSDNVAKTSVDRISFDTYNDFYFNNMYIKTGVNYYQYDDVYNTMSDSQVVGDSHITLTEATLNVGDDKNTLTLGIVPLYNGTINKFQSLDFSKSDSLPYLYNSIVQGVFYTRNETDLRITIGRAYYEKFTVNEIKMYDKMDAGTRGSDSNYLFINYSDDENQIIFNYSKTNWKYFEEDLYKQDLFGLTYIRDDLKNTGNLFYGGIGYQKGQGNNYPIVRDLFLSLGNNTDYTFNVLNTQDMYVGDFKTSGYFYVAGFRKEFDIHGKEHFLLLEHFKTESNWLSQNSGEPLNFWGTGRLGDETKIALGHYINSNLLLKVMYCKMNAELDYKDGGSAITQDIDSFSNNRVKDFESYSFGLAYKF